MSFDVIEKALYASLDVVNIVFTDKTIFKGCNYQRIIECDLVVGENAIPIVIAIPQNWQRILVDVYIKQNMEFPFIPHVDVQGKICLFDTEGILIDPNLCGIILQSIRRAKEIIREGLAGTNKADFIDEFDSYWIQLPSVRSAKVDVSCIQNVSVVKYFVKTVKRHKKESYARFL